MTKDRLTEFNNLNPTYVKILQNGSMVRDRDSDGVSDERNALLTNSGWNDTEQFLKKVSDVTENIEELERLLKEIKNIHKEILKTQEVKPLLIHSVKEVDEKFDKISKETTTSLHSVIIDANRPVDSDGAQSRIKNNQVGVLKKRLSDILTEAEKERKKYKNKREKYMVVCLKSLNPGITEEEIKEAVKSGKIHIMKSLNSEKDEKQIRILKELEDRNRELIQLGKNIEMVHQIFHEMAVFVEDKREFVDNILANVSNTVEYSQKTNQNAVGARTARGVNNIQVSLDFHNPEAVRCLTETLLKEDFNLDVILPKDALVPRIPQRLNYILLIEDLLIASGINDEVVGIDIGTGPSCIFPLLGADHCGWNFCATEINEESMKIAQLNIKNNGLETKVTVIRGHESSFFREVLGSHRETTFCFSMCNPPFFDKEECEAKFQVSEEGEFTNFPGKTEDFRRHGPMSATIAKSSELWVNGGEVAFLTRMIRESQIYRKRIKLFTSLIGKKKSIAPLKRVLDEIRFVFFTSHPISQGKTQRWVLVWTFDPNIKIHTESVKRFLSIPPSEENPASYFSRFCEFAGIITEERENGIMMCFIPSYALGFKPWKHKLEHLDDEPPRKKKLNYFSQMISDSAG